MVLMKNCSHKMCDHPVFACRHCGATVIQCKTTQHLKQGWCCDGCDHTKPKRIEERPPWPMLMTRRSTSP